MLKYVPHLARTTRLLLVAALLLAALGLSAARYWLLPAVDEYRQALQDNLSEALGQPLRIASLSARMRGFYPELVLRDVAVLDADSGTTAVWLGQVHLGVDLPRWLTTGQWRTDWIALQGADLALRQRVDGSIGLDGVPPQLGLPPWLFGYGRFELRDCRLRWRDDSRAENRLDLRRADLVIDNAGSHHRLAASLVPAEDNAGQLRLIAELDGDGQQPASLAGRIFLEGRVSAASWPLPEVGGYALRAGGADFRLWAHWRAGRLQQLAGWAALARPVVAYRPPDTSNAESQWAAQGIEGWFRWRRREDGWLLEMSQLRPDLTGSPWPAGRLTLGSSGPADAPALQLAADYLRLDDVGPVLHALAPGRLRFLGGLGLRGEARDLRAVYAADAEAGQRYGLCVTLAGFGVNAGAARPGIPGITDFTGSVCGNEREGVVDLAAGPGVVDAPRWLRAPVDYRRVAGRLRWRHEGEAWEVVGSGLLVETAAWSLQGEIRLAASSANEEPLLDWRAQLAGGDLAGLLPYLPARIMSPGLVAWLDEALVRGRIVGAWAKFRGPLGAFPSAQGEGRFSARLDVAGAELRYAEDWPALTDFSGSLAFNGESATVHAGRGRMAGADITGLTAHIDRLASGGRLAVAGRVEASLAQVRDFFAQSPKAALVENLKAHAESDGRVALDLLLGYRLGGDAELLHAQGEVRLENAHLHWREANLTLADLNGGVRFVDGRIKGDGLRATVLGSPVDLTLSGDGDKLHLALRGQASVQKLGDSFPSSWWSRLSGRLSYQAELALPKGLEENAQGLNLSLTTDLTNLSADLPAPYGKIKGEAGSVHLGARWDGQQQVTLRGEYKGLAALQAVLVKGDGGDWDAPAGELALGNAPLGDMPTAGWRVSGRLGAVPLERWWRWLQNNKGAAGYSSLIRQLELALERPTWEERELGPIALSLRRVTGGWDGYLESTLATGAVRLPPSWPSEAPLMLDMERINLPEMGRETLLRARDVQLGPEQLPALKVRSQHLLWRGHDLGHLDCGVEHRPEGLHLNQCTLASDLQTTHVEGEWRRSNGKDSSRLDGKIKIKDLGRWLASLDAGHDVTETKAKLNFALQWQDAPQRVTAAKLNGDVSVRLGQGSLRPLEPGLGRVLGLINIINIETFKRRLLLDFSDVFEEGLAYDRIRGTFKIAAGQAATRDLSIDAPSSRVFITGNVDLAGRTLDHTVTVVPRTSLAWPIVGTLAGGPAVGAAVLVAQQLVGEQLDSIAATQYAIKGGWDAPAVTVLSRNTPVEMLERAWHGLKDLSGFAEPEEENE